jgi:DNA-binding transcriptional LysR family regulator
MEMSQIRYALAAARTLNFTKAASDCNVSQPALTKAIKTLEMELGAQLFLREGKRVLLSDFGRSMLPNLHQIIDGADSARVLADSYRLLNQVPIRLGVMSTIGHIRLARFIARFERDHPGVELSIREQTVDELKQNLQEDNFDIVVLNPLDGLGEGFRTRPLYTERYVVIFPPDHRLRQLNAIRLRDLSDEPYVDRLSCELRELVTAACEDMEVKLYARFRSEREDWVQAMVLGGIGFAFMPEYSVTMPGLLQRPLVEPIVERSVCLASMPGRPFSPAVSAFVHAAERFSWPG